jgi:hypothetical protein
VTHGIKKQHPSGHDQSVFKQFLVEQVDDQHKIHHRHHCQGVDHPLSVLEQKIVHLPLQLLPLFPGIQHVIAGIEQPDGQVPG